MAAKREANRVVAKGEIMQLKSGGPAMVVMTVQEPGRITCLWHCLNGEVQFYTFPIECLRFYH